MTLASFSMLFSIFALDKNYVLENAFGESIKKPGARDIVVIKGEDIDSNIFTIGPHIHEWGAQFPELGGVIPHDVVIDYHVVSMLICKGGISREALLD